MKKISILLVLAAFCLGSFSQGVNVYPILAPAKCGGNLEVTGTLTADAGITFSNGTVINDNIATATAVIHTDTGDVVSQLAPISQFVTISSSNANYIINLPAISTVALGTEIKGFNPTTGFMLRIANADAATGTVYLNNVAGRKQATIAANSYFVIRAASATQWVLTSTSYAGAAIATITPGAYGY